NTLRSRLKKLGRSRSSHDPSWSPRRVVAPPSPQATAALARPAERRNFIPQPTHDLRRRTGSADGRRHQSRLRAPVSFRGLIMLRLARSEGNDLTRTLKLEGKLRGPVIGEVESACGRFPIPLDRALQVGA